MSDISELEGQLIAAIRRYVAAMIAREAAALAALEGQPPPRQ
jgi:hypothetical protein